MTELEILQAHARAVFGVSAEAADDGFGGVVIYVDDHDLAIGCASIDKLSSMLVALANAGWKP